MPFTQISSTNIQPNTVVSYAEYSSFAANVVPKVTTVNIANSTYAVLDDTAVNVGGGYIVITGSAFQSGAQVLIDVTSATSTTFINSTTLRAEVPAKSAATYNLYVVNPDGGTATKVNGLTYSGFPTWVTSSTLANVVSNTAFTGSLSATGATSYANTTSLPAGFNLVTANGYYYGNISVGSATTYSFTISATDAENQNSDRTFSLSAVLLNPVSSVEYLVVAGGGGGASHFGGGGGAGGALSGTLSVSTSTTYTVTVGGGGSGGTYSGGLGGNVGGTGSNSAFHTVTTIRGGGGAGRHSSGFQPTPGGSGGGGNSGEGGNRNGAAGVYPGSSYISSTRQGYDGGLGFESGGNSAGGGGGGAGATGGSASNLQGGTGGVGIEWPTSSGTYYAGGGGGTSASSGGASGGSGGGGSGGNSNSSGNNGTTNTGGGGGGANSGLNGSAGGSGIVIIRYPSSFDAATSTTGSPTITTSGGYRIYQFTGSGSITF